MNALQLLQQASGVKPDGVFGPATFKAAAAHLHLSDNRAVHFFAQCCHESGNFKYYEENLNYSADGLLKTFGYHFKDRITALAYERKPQKIANRVYANRMGNGDEASGDGWKHRGMGAIQLTGKVNQTEFFYSIIQPNLIDTPEVLIDKYAFDSAIFFFDRNNLWEICDKGTSEDEVTALTRRINGGFNGLGERIKLTEKFKAYLS